MSPAPAARSASPSSSTRAKGDGNQLMVNGFVMVGAMVMNKSPVTLDQVTPIARLTEEIQVIVVPANSPIKDAKDLAAALKADIAKVTFAGGSAGGVDHIMAALFAGAVGADATKVNYVPFSGGGEVARRHPRRQGHRRHFRLRRIRRPDQGRQAARHRRHLGRAACRASTCRPSRSRASISCSPTGARWWRRPASRAEQKKVLADAIDKLVKSPAWKEVLKQKGWDDAYLAGDAFADFLKKEQARVTDVLKSVGLVKS